MHGDDNVKFRRILLNKIHQWPLVSTATLKFLFIDLVQVDKHRASIRCEHSLTIYRTYHSTSLMWILSIWDVWMHLILIWVLYNFNLYILSIPHMDFVIIYLQCILPFTSDKVKLLLHIWTWEAEGCKSNFIIFEIILLTISSSFSCRWL